MDQTEDANARLRALIEEGLASGPLRPPTKSDEIIAARRARLKKTRTSYPNILSPLLLELSIWSANGRLAAAHC